MLLTAKQVAPLLGRKNARTVLKRPIDRRREGRSWMFEERDVQAYLDRHLKRHAPQPTAPGRDRYFDEILMRT